MWGSKPRQVGKASLLERHTHTHSLNTHTNITQLQIYCPLCTRPPSPPSHLNQPCQRRTLCTSHWSSTVSYHHLVQCVLQSPFKQTANTPVTFHFQSYWINIIIFLVEALNPDCRPVGEQPFMCPGRGLCHVFQGHAGGLNVTLKLSASPFWSVCVDTTSSALWTSQAMDAVDGRRPPFPSAPLQ